MFIRRPTPNSFETFARVAGLPPLDKYLFIEGGALAVENTLKAAMDWKVRKKHGQRATVSGERRSSIFATPSTAAAAIP